MFVRPSKRSLIEIALPEDDASRDSGIGSQPITFAKRYRSQDSQSSQVLLSSEYHCDPFFVGIYICRVPELLNVDGRVVPGPHTRPGMKLTLQIFGKPLLDTFFRRECPCCQSHPSPKEWWRRWRRGSTSTSWAPSWRRKRRRWKTPWVLALALSSLCLSSTLPSLLRPLFPHFPIGLLCYVGLCQ